MVQAEEQLQCVASWYRSWSPECRQQLIDFLVAQAVPDSIESLLETGVGYDGSSVPGHARVDDSDKLLVPLGETYRTIPFRDENMGFIIGRIDDEAGRRSAIDARGVQRLKPECI